MPPLRGLLWFQVLRAGPLHPEALVFLVGHDSSWSQLLPLPSPRVLPGQFVTAKVTSPPPEDVVSGWPQESRYVGAGFMLSTSAHGVWRKLVPISTDLWFGKKTYSFGSWTVQKPGPSAAPPPISEMELRPVVLIRESAHLVIKFPLPGNLPYSHCVS